MSALMVNILFWIFGLSVAEIARNAMLDQGSGKVTCTVAWLVGLFLWWIIVPAAGIVQFLTRFAALKEEVE